MKTCSCAMPLKLEKGVPSSTRCNILAIVDYVEQGLSLLKIAEQYYSAKATALQSQSALMSY